MTPTHTRLATAPAGTDPIRANHIASAPYVTVPLAAQMTGLTPKAIRRKIEDGKWIEGKQFRRAPDGGIFISIKGFQQWLEAV